MESHIAEWYKEFYKNILRKEDSLTNENEESTFRCIGMRARDIRMLHFPEEKM